MMTILSMSCSKEDYLNGNSNFEEKEKQQEAKNAITVENGVLHFHSKEIYSNTIDEIASMNENEISNWTSKYNYISYRSLLIRALDELENAENENDYKNKIIQHVQVIKEVDGSIQHLINDKIYSVICNENGIYKVVDHYYKYHDNHIYISDIPFKGNINTIYPNAHGVIANHKASKHLKSSNCGSYQYAQYTYDPSGNKNDRKVNFEMTVSEYMYYDSYYNMDMYKTSIKTRVWGQRRKTFGTGWKSYATTLHFQDGGYDITADPYGFFEEDFILSNWIFDSNGNDVYEITDYKWFHAGVYPWIRPVGYRVNKIKGMARSRGTGDNWATISCGY